MARLNRNFKIPADSRDSRSLVPFAVCLRDYHSPAVCDACSGPYSKLEAIRNLAEHLPDRGAALDIVRALLTDRGLLFPQTRERFYTQPRHSRYRSEEVSGVYRRGLREMGVDAHTDPPARARTFARQAYGKQAFSLPLDRAFRALDTMLADSREGRLPQMTAGEDVGYSKAELGRLAQSAGEQDAPADSAAGAVMEAWLNTVQLSFDGREAVSGHAYLQGELGFTVAESYEFLSEVLPACLAREEQYQICLWKLEPYEPVLAAGQEQAWRQQVARFHAEDLRRWKEALPALGQYLHLDTKRFAGVTVLDGIPDPRNSKLEKRLYAAFHEYLRVMEPRRTPAKSRSKGKKAKPGPEIDKALAVLFVNAVSITDQAAPLFMDLPSVIFHVFRSPVFRYIHQLEDRNWSLAQTVKRACIDFPLPITRQSLDADEKLYLAIVEVCEAYCKTWNVPFDAAPWRALWDCIRQAVLCLTFQKEDLLTVRYGYRRLLRYQSLGYPLLDSVLSAKLESGNAAAYIGLWRVLVSQAFVGKKALVKQPASPAHPPRPAGCREGVRVRRLHALRDRVFQYRVLFENAHADPDQVRACIQLVLKDSRFNRIAFLPGRGEWTEFTRPLQSRSATNPLLKKTVQKNLAVRTITAGSYDGSLPKTDGKGPHRRAIELIQAEWLLLQWNCQTARRELMSMIETLLKDG